MQNEGMPHYIADSTDSEVYEYFTATIRRVEEGERYWYELTIHRTSDGKLATRKKLNMARQYDEVSFPINISTEALAECLAKGKTNAEID